MGSERRMNNRHPPPEGTRARPPRTLGRRSGSCSVGHGGARRQHQPVAPRARAPPARPQRQKRRRREAPVAPAGVSPSRRNPADGKHDRVDGSPSFELVEPRVDVAAQWHDTSDLARLPQKLGACLTQARRPDTRRGGKIHRGPCPRACDEDIARVLLAPRGRNEARVPREAPRACPSGSALRDRYDRPATPPRSPSRTSPFPPTLGEAAGPCVARRLDDLDRDLRPLRGQGSRRSSGPGRAPEHSPAFRAAGLPILLATPFVAPAATRSGRQSVLGWLDVEKLTRALATRSRLPSSCPRHRAGASTAAHAGSC